MLRSPSFGHKIAAGFALSALLTIAISGLAIYTLRVVTATKDRVVTENVTRVLDVATMRIAREQRAKHVRSYLITGNPRFSEQMAKASDEFMAAMSSLLTTSAAPEERAILDGVAKANREVQAAWEKAMNERRPDTAFSDLAPFFEQNNVYIRALDQEMEALFNYESKLLADQSASASAVSSRAAGFLAGGAGLASTLAALITVLLSRGLHRKVTPTIERLQRSSFELQAAAAQQVASASELSATTIEIAATMQEVSAMTRQVSMNAKRAAQTAGEAGHRAEVGDATVERAQQAIVGIKRQVDVIVEHMLSLERVSRQVGGVLDLINELAAQTNILAINATIEAAGAGEAGKRFGVVASEIRRLADRVGMSAREIRELVAGIRRAADTTMAATESGVREVDVGSAQFREALSAFRHIRDQVAITTEMAREIELSTQQQVTAVEQVNHAIKGVTMAARESTSTSATTLDTSRDLASVSRHLATLLRPAEPGQRDSIVVPL